MTQKKRYLQIIQEMSEAHEASSVEEITEENFYVPCESEYEDWGAQSGIEHVYCIEAKNECGSSTMTCNPGSVKTTPDFPSYVSASDGEYVNEVQISWSGVDVADDFKIYRDSAWMGIIYADSPGSGGVVPGEVGLQAGPEASQGPHLQGG